MRQPFVMLVPPATPMASPRERLQRFELIRYDTALTGGRVAARYIRQAFPGTRHGMAVRSIDAIVAMVAAGLGVSIVPRPRQALLEVHRVRELALAKGAPVRQIALVRRRTDAGNRNIDAIFNAFASAPL